MSKTYEFIEDEAKMVEEPLTIADVAKISTADALWTLITQQARDIQITLKNRLDTLFADAEELPPYTMEELSDRIDEAERQIEAGETIPGGEVHQQMYDYINAYKL